MKATDRHYTASARSRVQRRRVIGFTAATMALCVALGVLAAVVLAAKGDTSLISRRSASAGGQGANGDSLSPSVSGTGGAVAFSTEATNLGGPAQNVSNIYVYTRGIRKVSLVSRRSAAAGGQGVNSGAFNPAITPSGRFVAFSTEATNLGGPAHAGSCIYVYDRKSRRVELVSRRSAAAGGAAANGDSFSPSISADGRFVAFDTDATNLGGPTNAGSNVYVYDREKDRVELVSRRSASAGGQGANSDSFGGEISADGRFVGFDTGASNLAGAAQNVTNVYVYDREQDRVELVSRRSASAGGQGADAAADAPTISGTGRFVAFRTTADNLGGPIQDVLNVYVYDRANDTIALVSRRSASAGGQGGNGSSGAGGVISLSANGRFVAFDTNASNLGGPVNPGTNVYVYDRKDKRIVLASRRSISAGGEGGNGQGRDPSLSADGRFVAFWTDSDNLGGPINANRNIYLHQHLLGP